ncbi:hypothetical protein [Candidatus Uabimicrobium amorphum]|uniref:Uncharacterized protein n=1 Tax=Uabimicrobium amorphum TaxID=2596890 RepID=A0A5S9IJU9_UABAM|nr:hypothetical protein [Candidatus Uabimicrobium amorphum]BBM83209.1 hypothetical protein UABAM_01560 [Candidatus Uabimicrobium amorphum]
MLFSKQLSFIKNISWDEIIHTWKQDEVDQAFWQKIYKEYPSWEAWREACLKKFALPKDDWKVYRIHDPVLFASMAYCGPFHTWFKHYSNGEFPTEKERERSTFGYIVPNSSLKENPKINSIMHDFPQSSQVLGVSDGHKFMLYEGHHRMSALTLAKEQGIEIATELSIALRLFSVEEFRKHFYPQRTHHG